MTSIDIPLESMSVAEKLALMERLWEDLSRRPADIPVPPWQEEVLEQRMEAVRQGRTAFGDWDEAKRRLRERLE